MLELLVLLLVLAEDDFDQPRFTQFTVLLVNPCE